MARAMRDLRDLGIAEIDTTVRELIFIENEARSGVEWREFRVPTPNTLGSAKEYVQRWPGLLEFIARLRELRGELKALNGAADAGRDHGPMQGCARRGARGRAPSAGRKGARPAHAEHPAERRHRRPGLNQDMSDGTAQLLISAAGAAAGFAIAGPQGEQLGWTAGSAVGKPVIDQADHDEATEATEEPQ
jgi:hypothetical protein